MATYVLTAAPDQITDQRQPELFAGQVDDFQPADTILSALGDNDTLQLRSAAPFDLVLDGRYGSVRGLENTDFVSDRPFSVTFTDAFLNANAQPAQRGTLLNGTTTVGIESTTGLWSIDASATTAFGFTFQPSRITAQSTLRGGMASDTLDVAGVETLSPGAGALANVSGVESFIVGAHDDIARRVVLTDAYATATAAVTGDAPVNRAFAGQFGVSVGAAQTGPLTIDASDFRPGHGVFVSAVSAGAPLSIVGGAGSDTLSGGGAADTLIGGAGDDTITPGSGDVVTGGVGDDVINLSATPGRPVTVTDFGAGDTFNASTVVFDPAVTRGTGMSTGFGRIEVGTPADGLTPVYFGLDSVPGADATYLLGGSIDPRNLVPGPPSAFVRFARDLIDQPGTYRLTAGADSASLSDGDDAIAASIATLNPADVVDGRGGRDTLILDGVGDYRLDAVPFVRGYEVVLGAGGANSVTLPQSTTGRLVAVFDGDDSVLGSGLVDTVFGGDGRDTLSGLVVLGEAGDDSLTGDTAFGGAGNDTAVGGTLVGDDGDDQLTGLLAFGGAGNDVLRAINMPTFVPAAPPAGSYLLGDLGSETGSDMLFGGGGADTLFGGNGADRLLASDAADILVGQAGADALVGGRGNDLIEGDAGDDAIDGGAGVDLAAFSGPLSAYSFARVAADTYRVAGPDGVDLVAGTEFLAFSDGLVSLADLAARGLVPDAIRSGTAASDTLIADAGGEALDGLAGGDALVGGVGRDVLSGGAGNDTLLGDDGPDSLAGGEGHDTLAGGAGDDTLVAGPGDDVLVGGAGADLFVFGEAPGRDMVVDYNPGEGDRIVVVGLAATASPADFLFNNGPLALSPTAAVPVTVAVVGTAPNAVTETLFVFGSGQLRAEDLLAG